MGTEVAILPGGRFTALFPRHSQPSTRALNSVPTSQNFFHVHLISDATGETLIAVARAAAAQYSNMRAIEHVHPLVRNAKQVERILSEVEAEPGIVLYTLVNPNLGAIVEKRCRELSLPTVSVLAPVLTVYRSYLGTESTPKIGGQHVLDADYFRRIDALNYTMLHDDGQHIEGLGDADVVLVGISRTSKTPTSIYLANRGIKTANVPLVPGVTLPPMLLELNGPLVIGLIATPERIVQIRRNRLLSINAHDSSSYVDREAIIAEIAETRKLCARQGWPILDVTRRSIEETAAGIISLFQDHKDAAAERQA